MHARLPKVALIAILCLLHGLALAEKTVSSPADTDAPTTIRLSVTPADEPKPALKHRLLPEPVELERGNAATFYYRAMVNDGPDLFGGHKSMEKFSEWTELSAAKLPVEEVQKTLEHYQSSYAELKRATYRDSCFWEDPIRSQGYGVLLPATQKSRAVARMLNVKAGLEIRQQRFDQALETLRVSFALGRNVAEGETLVQVLVGVAVAGVTADRVEDFIAQPGSPNLYWALTALPHPFVNTRKSLSFESRILEFSVPELRELDKRRFSPREVEQLFDKLTSLGDSPSSRRYSLERMLWAVVVYPRAAAFLQAQGLSRAEIEQLPALQVILLAGWKEYQSMYQEMAKWTYVTDPAARARLDETQKRFSRSERGAPFQPFTVVLPALGAAMAVPPRIQRHIAGLRTIEALRMYAARHQGKWPPTLSAIKDVIVPRDPESGQQFRYRLEGDKAILDIIHPGPPDLSKSYILTIQQ